MPNLIAYIPVINKRYFDWLREHQDSFLYLISQEQAEELLPRLKRMRTIGLSSETVHSILENEQLVARVFHGPNVPNFLFKGDIIMPDEDVSHQFTEIYLNPKENNVRFEEIWARYDMRAVSAQSPVVNCAEISRNKFFEKLISCVKETAKKSPDWWRQIGALIVKDGVILAEGFNQHFPNEYEQDALGDPRLNYEAGQAGEYISLHAERSCIAQCARLGKSTNDALMLVTCFPCIDCARWIVKAGIKQVFFIDGYSSMNAQEVLETYNVSIIKII